MKVIQINCTYNKGSTGKIVYLLHDYLLKQGDDSLVLYGVGENNIDILLDGSWDYAILFFCPMYQNNYF